MSIDDGRLFGVIRFVGVPFEVINDHVLDNNYDSLNNAVMSIAKGFGKRLAVWGYIDHFKTEFDDQYNFSSKWMQDFSDRYLHSVKKRDSFENEFSLAFILNPDQTDELDDTIRDLTEILNSVSLSLGAYEPEILTLYEENNVLFSQVHEFLGYLHNGIKEKVPVTAIEARETITSSMLHWHYRTLETRTSTGRQIHSAFSDLKDFPHPTRRGMLNPLLEASFPFLMAMSFTFLTPAKAIKLINEQQNKLESSGDEAIEQMSESEMAKGAIASGDIYFGELHAVLVISANTEKEAETNAANARTMLSSYSGALFTAATITAPESFYSLFPGNTKHRPRVLPKTTRNYFGLFSMNTYSSGKHKGNPIGDGSAIMPLRTSVHGVYHFNYHYSMNKRNALGEKVAGHTLILGETGSGKTTLQATLLGFSERFAPKIFALDREGSMRGIIEGLGGDYFTLNAGVPTGLNPFQLPISTENREFLYQLVESCGRSDSHPYTAEDKKDIRESVNSVLKLELKDRRFGMLLQNIPDRGANSLHRRLSEWCYGETAGDDGRFAYALDNAANKFDAESFHRVGFDVKDFLVAGHPVTEPLLSYLLHLKKLMNKQRGLLITSVEEFWLPISYPTTAEQIKDILKTGRRRDEWVLLVSQSPKDVIKSPLLADILEQTQTKIFLPNPNAVYRDPVSHEGYENLGLTVKEFNKLPKDKFTRQFLIKQGGQSSIAKLDLQGMEDDIAILAMADEDFPYLEQAKELKGDNPDDFLPAYTDLRRTDRAKKYA